MRFSPQQHLNSDDFRNSPEWFRTFLESFNNLADSINGVLAGGVDIANNMRAELQSVTVSHNTPITVKLNRLKVQPSFVLVGYASGYVGVAGITQYGGDSVTVVVQFLGNIPPKGVVTSLWFM